MLGTMGLGSVGLGAATTGAGLLWAPSALSEGRNTQRSAGHNAYFSQLNTELKRGGPGYPAMLVDLSRVNHNIDQIVASVGKHKTYRVVVKSLPSVPLLKHVMQRANTQALMVFHQPFLNAVADAFPSSDVLIGKPFPVAAVRAFYRKLGASKFDPATQVQWLVDSHQRLLQYQALAHELGISMGVSFEIDVGLHRGGFAKPVELDSTLDVIAADPKSASLKRRPY